MALLFMESFSHYDSAGLIANGKWTNFNQSNGSIFISSGTGRYVGNSLRIITAGVNQAPMSLSKTFNNNIQTWIIGFAVKLDGNSANYLLQLYDGGTLQCGLFYNSDSTLTVTRGSTPLTNSINGLTRSNQVLVPGAWNYLEWKININPSVPSGSSFVILNSNSGSPIFVVSGTQSTRASANSSANALAFTTISQNFFAGNFDDIYVCDGTGPAPWNNVLGDIKIEPHFAVSGSAVGNSQWAGSGTTAIVATPLLAIQQPYPSGDKAVIYTSGVNQTSTFIMPPLSDRSNHVYGIQTCLMARKDSAGGRQITDEIVSGGVSYSGGNPQFISASYQEYMNVWPTDPNTGVAWTIQGVNAIEAGIEEVT